MGLTVLMKKITERRSKKSVDNQLVSLPEFGPPRSPVIQFPTKRKRILPSSITLAGDMWGSGKSRNYVMMKQYLCKSKLTITYRKNKAGHPYLMIYLQHHIKHVHLRGCLDAARGYADDRGTNGIWRPRFR